MLKVLQKIYINLDGLPDASLGWLGNYQVIDGNVSEQ